MGVWLTILEMMMAAMHDGIEWAKGHGGGLGLGQCRQNVGKRLELDTQSTCCRYKIAKELEGGAEGEIRTPTPLRALRPERSASAVSPLRHIGLPVIIPPRSWWAMLDSNQRPLRCERSALTS